MFVELPRDAINLTDDFSREDVIDLRDGLSFAANAFLVDADVEIVLRRAVLVLHTSKCFYLDRVWLAL